MIKSNKIILFISTILFVLFSCSSMNQNSILGSYKYSSKISFGKLILSDNIFEYEYNVSLNSFKSKGTWTFDGNLLVLRSYDFFKNNYMIVEEKKQEESYVQILDRYNLPLQNLNIVINSELIFKTDVNGKVNIKSLNGISIKSIKVESIDLSKDNNIYFSAEKNSTLFLIKIIPIDYEKRFFNNESFVVKNNKVIIDNQKYVKTLSPPAPKVF